MTRTDPDLLFSFSGPRGRRDDSMTPVLSGERSESIGLLWASTLGKGMGGNVEGVAGATD